MDKEGSWIPAKPAGSQLIFTDMVNCLDSEQLGSGEACWQELSTKNMPNFDLWGTGMMGFTDLLELANVGSTSDPLKPDSFLPSRGEESIPSRFSFDLNSIPKANAEAVSPNISSKFVPLTPEQSNSKQASRTQILNNKVANKRIEVIEIDDDDSDGDYSQNKDHTQTQLQDNQNPDTGTDMNKTPQQQKPRRRKHRPKVVREGGKPARPRKPSVPRTVSPKELGPSGKRKYVRKKTIETPQANTPSEQVNVESMEPKIAESSKRSCRRSLNFDNHNNEVRDESSSYKPPSTFGKESHSENFVGRVQSSQVDATHDKERVINTNDSTCSSSVCLNTEQAKGLKRINSSTATNAFGSHYNSLQAFEAAFLSNGCCLAGTNFPAIHMEKRTDKFYSVSTASSTSTVTAVQNQVKVNLAAASGVEDNHRALQCALAVSQGDNNLKKKRSKGPTKVGDFDSLFGTSLPAGTYQPYACIETSAADTCARLARKKHTKRNPHVNCMPLTVYNHYQRITKPRGRPCSIKRRAVNSLEALLEQFSHLNISAEQYQNALVPYKKDKKRYHYNDQNALVLYQRDGTVVPFDGEFNPLKKRKPRPKVNLDDETSRVWKLLLQDINSVGIDGTDEEKAKWWDEERSVFRGRAESFIARMHLVQGDRRFSKWKGSVVDSCVGVFLTQNVSDHLSSSAFMALAARYPLKSKTSNNQSNKEETTRFAQQPEFHVTEPEETIEWRADKPDRPAFQQSSMTIIDAEEVINSNESFESTSDRDISKKSVNFSAEEKETMKIGDDREQDDMISSQDSVVSSQNSVDSSSIAQNVSCSQSSSETETAVAFKSNVSSGPASFLELLRMAQRAINDDSNNEPSEWKLSLKNPQEQEVSPTTAGHLHLESNIADFESCDDRRNEDICVVSEHSGVSSESPKTSRTIAEAPKGSVPNQIEERRISQTDPRVSNFAGEILDVTESTNIVDKSNCEPLAVETKSKSGRVAKGKSDVEDWDILRKVAQETHGVRERDPNTMDSVDWETIRCADVNEIAYTIRERGMNNMLAERIKDFLNRLVREHGSADLEWLRDVPPDKAKQYLLSFRGLGLKSVECVRLLTLHHLAFPVDTNVGRIAVRLGWVPLQPLPESLQLHLLEMYPILESIQKFLWPRLCKLDQPTLYELHYQLITFGKVFCTKSKPNCNACPMRGECRHFASAFASARLALPAPEEKSIVPATENIRAASEAEVGPINRLQLPAPQPDHQLVQPVVNNNFGPIIEEPASPEPIIEVPPSPEPEKTQIAELDIEDFDEIPTIKLNIEQFTQNLQNYMHQVQDGDMSKALVALTQDAASLPTPKLKNVSRLRTEHQVYELPDSHPLLEGLDRREPDDPCSYLLAIWTPGETPDSVQPPEGGCNPQETGILCEEKTCFSCNNIRESNNQTVRGTLLIPCRTAMRGSFPLNGTYFQVNEVFADHDSSLNPIDVPRSWIWNLPRRTVYFGTSIPAIFKGLTTEGIQFCFWKGFVCVRGFEQKTRSPRPLMARLHFPASKMVRTKGKPNDS